jgi:hypothetical protein
MFLPNRKKEKKIGEKRNVVAHGEMGPLITPWVSWDRGLLGPADCIIFASRDDESLRREGLGRLILIFLVSLSSPSCLLNIKLRIYQPFLFWV